MRRALLVALVAHSAHAEGLLVSPSIIAADVDKNGDALPPLKIKNEASEPWECELALRPLGQALDGTPRPAPPGYPFSAHSLLTLKPARVVLAPGETHVVALRAAAPTRTGGGYALLEVRGRPVAGGAWVVVGAEVRLTYPGDAKAALSSGSLVTAQDRAGASLVVAARVKNDGDVALAVTGAATISDAAGKIVGQATLGPAVVLPGFERLVRGTAAVPPPGTYALAATLAAPGAPAQSATGSLEVIRPGEIAAHRVDIERLEAPPATTRESFRVQAVVRNRGNLPVAAVGRAIVRDAAGETVASATLAPPMPVPVGKKGTLAGVVSGLPAGDYEIEVTVENTAGRPLAAARTPLAVRAGAPRAALRVAATRGEATLVLDNGGTAPADVEGVVQAVDAEGVVIGQIALERRRVAPGETATWRAPLPAGVAEVRALFDVGGAAPVEGRARVAP